MNELNNDASEGTGLDRETDATYLARRMIELACQPYKQGLAEIKQKLSLLDVTTFRAIADQFPAFWQEQFDDYRGKGLFTDFYVNCAQLVRSSEPLERAFFQANVDEYLKQIGLKYPDVLKRTWLMSTPGKLDSERLADATLNNLQKIILLEEEQLGLSRFYYDKFLLNHFSQVSDPSLLHAFYDNWRAEVAADKTGNPPSPYEHWRRQIDEGLQAMGFNEEDQEMLHTAWHQSGIEPFCTTNDNYMAMVELQETHKNNSEENEESNTIAADLFRQFGIRHFHRYSTDLLLEQYRERDEPGQYAVVINAITDWNNAFFNAQSIYEDLAISLNRYRIKLRIVEAATQREIISRLRQFRRAYCNEDGMPTKISAAVIGGHGQEDSISLSDFNPKSKTYISSADLLRPGSRLLRLFFSPQSSILLQSCSTGANEDLAIGKTMARELGVTVTAPKLVTHLSKIDVLMRPSGKGFVLSGGFQTDGEDDVAAHYDALGE